MADESGAAPSGGDATPSSTVEITAPAGSSNVMSVTEAARFLAKQRKPAAEQPETPQEPATEEPATEQPEAPEGQEQPEPEQKPEPVKLPKSWQADREEQFKALPEDVRKLILEADDRHQGELTTAQKAAEAARKERAAEIEQANALKAQYEQALPTLLQMMQQHTAGEYGDIKTHDDVAKLANEDPHRYLKFMAHQQKVQALQAEAKAVEERQQAETGKRWEAFSEEQDKKFAEKFPEVADKAKAEKITSAALNTLQEVGFTQQELHDLWNGKSGVSLRDARVQALIFNAARYDEAQKLAKEAKAKPLPPVQRPGVSQPKGGDTAQVKALDDKLNRTGSLKVAAALLTAKRRKTA